ncbi:MAG: GNAT family N-acetyltransferase [Treponema sp.]|jgi:Leu/Phe-tRNA-protein transferase|nr:GNAT family N-acetyltransferase [Treponema sp.]
MNSHFIRYTQYGQIFIAPEDDPDWIVDVMLETGYDDEFCYALDFDPAFIAALMRAGFLVMSAAVDPACGPDGKLYSNYGPRHLLLPKLHLERSALFWKDLHETGTARRLLKRYELRYDADFDRILDRCVQVHGGGWLTPPLLQSIRAIRAFDNGPVRPVSFALYRNGELVAGEFGVVTGRVYTSYSGYRDEDSAGTVQLALTGRYLRDAGFAFWDLGMPLDYKDRLGARNISPRLFVDLFRKALVTVGNYDKILP